jgi:hypothetical protein
MTHQCMYVSMYICFYLLRHDGEDREEDAVELVEAAPEPSLFCLCVYACVR